MKTPSLRTLALLLIAALGAAACDSGLPTVSSDDGVDLPGTGTTGVLDTDPLFRDLGPSFDLGGLTELPNGLLAAAADKKGKDHLHAVRRAETLRNDKSKTRRIRPARGGVIPIGRAGMRVVIPAGALPGTEPIDITVVAYKGKYHVYEFLPHGLQFNAPITVEFDITNVQRFGRELEQRRAAMEKLKDLLVLCQERVAEGAKLNKKCREILKDWDDLTEDLEWYQTAVSADGFYGVYFEGDVKRGGQLEALELFDVDLANDQLIFQTTHFSGYALGM